MKPAIVLGTLAVLFNGASAVALPQPDANAAEADKPYPTSSIPLPCCRIFGFRTYYCLEWSRDCQND